MKTFDDLKQFYENELYSNLVTIENRRKAILNKIYLSCGIVAGIALAIIIFLISIGCFQLPVMLFIFIASALLIGFIIKIISSDYKADFKFTIMKKIVNFIDENLSYFPNGGISLGEYNSSALFNHKVDDYHSEDLVAGTVGKTEIKFSEVHSQYVTRNSKGQTTSHTIFKGLLCSADFNKHFKGRTFVSTDLAENMFGRFGQMLQSKNNSKGHLVKLEDPDFEKYFAVYSTDQIEARYILSTSLMHRILEYRKSTKKQVQFSFICGNMFVAIPYTKNLFEPRIFRTMLDFSPIYEYFQDLRLAVSLVEELNLNTRIWSK